MRKIIVHVGFPKTGTTSIQRFCDLHRRELRSLGVDYPRLSITEHGEKIKPNHKALITALMQSPPARLQSEKAPSVAVTTDAFARFMRSRQSTLFLSHETISRRDDIDFARLRSWSADLPITVIAVVRTLDEWIESLYAQNLRSDKAVTKSIMSSGLSELAQIGFVPQLRVIRAALPDASVQAVSFDRYRRCGLIEKMLRLIGADTPAMLAAAAATERENAARPAVEVLFGAYAAIAEDDAALTRQLVGAFAKARKDGRAIPSGERDFRFLPAALKVEARETYRRDLDVLRAEFGLEVDDPGPVPAGELAYTSSLTEDEFDALYGVVKAYLPRRQADAIASAYAKAHPFFAGTAAARPSRGQASATGRTLSAGRKVPGQPIAIADDEWALIAPLLPGGGGRVRPSARDRRRDFEAMVWMARPGARWKDLPGHYGRWHGVYQRYQAWLTAGAFAVMAENLAKIVGPDTGADASDDPAVRAHRWALQLQAGLAIPMGLADRSAEAASAPS